MSGRNFKKFFLWHECINSYLRIERVARDNVKLCKWLLKCIPNCREDSSFLWLNDVRRLTMKVRNTE